MNGPPADAHELQWGGRFASAPDAALLAYGSSLAEDLAIARFDAQCSRAHVAALVAGKIIPAADGAALEAALERVEAEIADGSFEIWAKARGFEDVHGAIDARVREIAGAAGDRLHSGRSRNDQVATTMLLFVRERAWDGARLCTDVAALCADRAAEELQRGTLLAATTHWQPAQPVLLAQWIDAVARGFVRAAERFARVAQDAQRFSPLGSAALAGSSLPLGRAAAAELLAFEAPSENSLDAVGDRDVLLDFVEACMRAVLAASRPSEELVVWATPAFGYVRLDDAASTGSSLMPQKRNPDPFELIRAAAGALIGAYAGAAATVKGVALSYHRDLQTTKSLVIRAGGDALGALDAFRRAFAHVQFRHDAMTARAGAGYTIATDLADALIAAGATAREAHRAVGERVLLAEAAGRELDENDLQQLGIPNAPLDPRASVLAKRTSGSAHPDEVSVAIDATRAEVARVSERIPSYAKEGP
ncbi:MAG: argininosuccinate lyase [Candidatus Eremiobacteraeota bacterium]|nr:argininosuccinate lyase [Candidatus Eremiobacteraeota bacterium]